MEKYLINSVINREEINKDIDFVLKKCLEFNDKFKKIDPMAKSKIIFKKGYKSIIVEEELDYIDTLLRITKDFITLTQVVSDKKIKCMIEKNNIALIEELKQD